MWDDATDAFSDFFHQFKTLPDKENKAAAIEAMAPILARIKDLVAANFVVEVEGSVTIWARDYTRQHERQRVIAEADHLNKQFFTVSKDLKKKQLIVQVDQFPYW